MYGIYLPTKLDDDMMFGVDVDEYSIHGASGNGFISMLDSKRTFLTKHASERDYI